MDLGLKLSSRPFLVPGGVRGDRGLSLDTGELLLWEEGELGAGRETVRTAGLGEGWPAWK